MGVCARVCFGRKAIRDNDNVDVTSSAARRSLCAYTYDFDIIRKNKPKRNILSVRMHKD